MARSTTFFSSLDLRNNSFEKSHSTCFFCNKTGFVRPTRHKPFYDGLLQVRGGCGIQRCEADDSKELHTLQGEKANRDGATVSTALEYCERKRKANNVKAKHGAKQMQIYC